MGWIEEDVVNQLFYQIAQLSGGSQLLWVIKWIHYAVTSCRILTILL